jgi:hypothetical protein
VVWRQVGRCASQTTGISEMGASKQSSFVIKPQNNDTTSVLASQAVLTWRPETLKANLLAAAYLAVFVFCCYNRMPQTG